MEKYEIEKLRQLPIEEVAQRLGLQVARHKSLCPFHSDHHASLTYNTRKNTCRCFVCMDKPMGTIDLVMRHLHVDFPVACRWLADKGNVYLSETFNTQHSTLNTQHSTFNTQHSTFDSSRYLRFFEHPWLGDEARRFLFEERRIDPRVAQWCRLASWQDRDGTHWLQIPYFSTDGKLIGVQNRNLDYRKDAADASKSSDASNSSDASAKKREKPRFRFPYGAKCGIYNLPVTARLREGDELYITEGCSDCWAMLSAGHKAIAIPSATLLSPKDRQLLLSLGKRLQISWHMYPDQDAPGERLFMQLQELLPQLHHHQLPPGCKDFGERWKNGNIEIWKD